MKIPFFSHVREFEAHREALMDVVERCLRSPSLILGNAVRSFEGAFAKRIGRNYTVGVGNCTDALALALRALDIGQEDEVITTANTAIPTVSAIRMVGALPRFVDIDPKTLLMDTSKLEKVITTNTKAILPVHLFGNVAPMKEICDIAKHHKLRVIEDCAQAFGASVHGQHVGTFGDIGCFSFYPTKNLGAWGDGGMCVTNDPLLAERLRRLRVYGTQQEYIAEEEGVNSRLDELQAAILLTKLTYIDDDLRRRSAIAKIYDAAIAGSEVKRPETSSGAEHAFHLYVIRCPDRAKMNSFFVQHGIATLVHYPCPLHLMPAYRFLEYSSGSLPVTEIAAQEILSIPIFPYLTEEEINHIGKTLKDAVR